MTPVMTSFLEVGRRRTTDPRHRPAQYRRGRVGRDVGRRRDRAPVRTAMYARALRALIRDTLSPDIVHAGVKYNVIPGDAVIEVDCRVLPGTTEPRCAPRSNGAWAPTCCGLRHRAHRVGRPRRSAGGGPAVGHPGGDAAGSRPGRIPLPVMVPFATDAKATSLLGVPTYGFSPLRLDPDERFSERFHGVDERVSLDALRFGLPVLYDVVRRFCG